MADEAAPTVTETSAPTETTTSNDGGVETTALGGAWTETAGAAEQGADTSVDTTDAGEGGGSEGDEGGDGEGGDTPAAEVPEAYELTAPEGMTIKPEHVELVTPVLKELGLSNDQANKLMPVAAQFAQSIADDIATQQLQQVADWRRERFEEARNDPEIGGAKWDESVSYAAKALDRFGAEKGSPFRTALDESGWGNHVEMVRMFAKIGRAIGEDSDFVRTDAGAPVRDAATTLYPNDTPKGGN